MKLKSNQTRTYDGDGYKKRAACLCFRSESEEEVRRRRGSGSAAASRRGCGGDGAGRGGAAVGGPCARTPGGTAGLDPNEVPTGFPEAEKGKERGWWAGGRGSSPAFGARRAEGGARPCQRRAGRGARGECGGRSAAGLRSGRGSSALVSPAHVCGGRGARARAAPLWPSNGPLPWQVGGQEGTMGGRGGGGASVRLGAHAKASCLLCNAAGSPFGVTREERVFAEMISES